MLEIAGNGLLVVLGISFLIFMHEVGHFLAARAFGVRVEIFSIGFGPRILGWRRGDTEYRVSWVPLGGYVKMAGEYMDLEDDTPARTDDVMAKPIWQRLVIYSAGVIMNIALAFVLFPIAYGSGVPFIAPQVGGIEAGGAAWAAGLEPGDTFLTIDGRRIYGFSDIRLETALSGSDGIDARILRDGEEIDVHLSPVARAGAEGGLRDIGIWPPFEATLTVDEDGPATGDLQNDDLLISAGDYAVGEVLDGTVLDPRETWQLATAERGAVDVVVDRAGTRHTVTVTPMEQIGTTEGRLLGALPLHIRLAAVRGAAERVDFPLRVGDLLVTVAGQDVYNPANIRDALSVAPDGALPIRVDRAGQILDLTLDPQARDTILARDVAFDMEHERDTRIQVLPDGALHDSGLVDGDTILAINQMPIPNYAALLEIMSLDPERVDYTVEYQHGEIAKTIQVRARPRTPVTYDYGISFKAVTIVRDYSITGAMTAGWDATINALRNTGLTLSKLIVGEVGAENLGGPVQISVITYEAAKWDFAKLLHFLALLSVNLGIINILPIPVLDGGQILFLLCEKVKGSRLSLRFMQNVQIAGFVAILALLAYVTFNDIRRVVG